MRKIKFSVALADQFPVDNCCFKNLLLRIISILGNKNSLFEFQVLKAELLVVTGLEIEIS